MMSSASERRAEKESQELLEASNREDGVRLAKEWAKRVITDCSWGDDRKLGVVKGNLGQLMDLVQRQELAIRLQEGTVIKIREDMQNLQDMLRARR